MSEISHKTLRTTIQNELSLKIKFTDLEQAYALLALLSAQLPKKTTPTTSVETAEVPDAAALETADAEEAAKPAKIKKIKKAKVVSVAEAELLAPADSGATAAVTLTDAPTLGATDEFRANKYRLQTLARGLCVGRRYDEKNPIIGTRTCDEGANGILYPELQCTKKPLAGGPLCTTCLAREAEYMANPAKPPKSWYGRLDEPLYAKSRIIGSEWFLANYPSGIEGAAVEAAAAPAKTKKDKAPKTAPAAAETATEAAPKKAKKEKTPKVAPTPVAEVEEAAEEAPAPAKKPDAAPKPKKATVASSGSAKEAEWVSFFADGTLLIRHSKTGNVYQCDQSKHRLEDMVQRDKFEGKWRGGRLDPYGEEDDE